MCRRRSQPLPIVSMQSSPRTAATPRNEHVQAAMKFGVKQKILLVLIGVLALTTALAALFASYFTNRQNEQIAFAELNRDLLSWREDLHTSVNRWRDVAISTMSDEVILNQLAELVMLDLNLHEISRQRESSEA